MKLNKASFPVPGVLNENGYTELELVRGEAAKQEKLRLEITQWMEHDADGRTFITSAHHDLLLINAMEETAKRIASSKGKVTKLDAIQPGHKLTMTKSTRLGERMLALCRLYDPAFPVRHGHHVFNPWIKVILVALRHWCGFDGFGKEVPGIGITPEDRDSLNRIARFVRRVCQSEAFKRRLREDRRLARQNYRSACDYVLSLFARYSRLLILRVDLYYKGEGKDWARTEDAEKAFRRFMRKLRSGKIVPDFVGALCRREEGAARGIHYHLLVVMNGHKRKDAYGFTEDIGECWVEEYTGRELGAFYNCYDRRHEYAFNGLGLVHVSDWRKLIGLSEAIRYMTKPDYQVKDKSNAEKSFRRGRILPMDVKRGAPRESGHDLSIARRFLAVVENFGRSTSRSGKSWRARRAP